MTVAIAFVAILTIGLISVSAIWIYKGSKHYVAPENGPTPGINWIRQWKTLFDWYPDTKFIKVNRYNDGRDLVNGPIEEWTNENLTYTDYSTLDNLV